MKGINEQPMYKNYKRNPKFLGIIDYKSLLAIVIYSILILNIVRIIPFSGYIRVCIFLFSVIPVASIFCININNDSTIEVILNIIKFMLNKKYFVNLSYVKDHKSYKWYNN